MDGNSTLITNAAITDRVGAPIKSCKTCCRYVFHFVASSDRAGAMIAIIDIRNNERITSTGGAIVCSDINQDSDRRRHDDRQRSRDTDLDIKDYERDYEEFRYFGMLSYG